MHKNITRVSVAVAAAAILGTLGMTGAGASGAPSRLPSVRTAARTVPGAQLWVNRYNGPGNGGDGASSVAVSPNGATVFVTGISKGKASGNDYATIAYKATTGARLWVKRYSGPGNHFDQASSVAVSPRGDRVFVTGESTGATSGEDYATVAYNAATGAQLWAKRYSGPGNGRDIAYAAAVSPNGGTVFVTGASRRASGYEDYATVAYRAATGARLWVKRYNGPANRDDGAFSVAVSPSGSMVFVTGESLKANGYSDYATVAYSAATGAQVWVKRYTGVTSHGGGIAVAMAVSPTGKMVFVTGYGGGIGSDYDYATVAYKAATGAQVWVKRYNGPANRRDIPYSIAISPTGGTVFITGFSESDTLSQDYTTVAYSTATGAQVWVARYGGPGEGGARSVAVSHSGNKVFVTGILDGYGTVAYSAVTGAQLWVKRYHGPANSYGGASAVAASPSGSTVFVTGASYGSASGTDYATIAYTG